MGINFFKWKKSSKVVSFKGNEYDCLLVKTDGDGKKPLYLNVMPNGVDIKVGVNKVSFLTSLCIDFMKLMPSDGGFTTISRNYHVSNVYTLIQLWTKDQLERVYVLEEKNGEIFREGKSSLVDNAVAKMFPQSTEYANTASKDNKREQRSNENPERFAPRQTPNQHGANHEKLVKIALMINEKSEENIINMNQILNSSTDVLIEALKKGVEQLLNRQSQSQRVTSQEETVNNARLHEKINALEKQIKILTEDKENAEETIQNKDKELEQLKQDLRLAKTDIIDIKGDAIKAADSLLSALEMGGYQIDCATAQSKDDPYLISQVRNIRQQLQDIPNGNAATTRNALKDIIRKHLSESDDVLNKLGCIMAYGRIPFMIEPRANGIYINPGRISNIYNKLEMLLVPLGFQQILPQLFVETMSDGIAYYEDVTGRQDAPVSLLDMLCPSLGQHKENVDRGQRMQVIKDIAQIGFLEDGIIIEKTKVLL